MIPKIRNTYFVFGAVQAGIGLLVLSTALFNKSPESWLLFVALTLLVSGGICYTHALYNRTLPGIKNNGVWHKGLTGRGWGAWVLAVVLTAFYVALYWYPETLGYNPKGTSSGLVGFFDPLSLLLNGKPASQWFVYGTLYTLAILIFGYKFIRKYRHNRYQVVRTISVMFFQLGFAFLIPEILAKLNPQQAYFNMDLKNMWPLDYDFFYDWHLNNLIKSGSLGMFMLMFGLGMVVLISPILTYFFGKRWYCSWVCGCGGLAETAGDPFRQLSSKKRWVWQLERWSVHLVLFFVSVMTLAVLYSYLGKYNPLFGLTQDRFVYGSIGLMVLLAGVIFIYKRKKLNKDALMTMGTLGAIVITLMLMNHSADAKQLFFVNSYKLREWYGFGIGAAFSGVIGVGFYPILGSRVWCRFGCPMAAILGLQQRLFSKFRITTNGGQCISCGNCSVYCEMGIDVRAYAQKGEHIVRSSCVGCGICSAVCPRGVLKLENVAPKNRMNGQKLILDTPPDLLDAIKLPS